MPQLHLGYAVRRFSIPGGYMRVLVLALLCSAILDPFERTRVSAIGSLNLGSIYAVVDYKVSYLTFV